MKALGLIILLVAPTLAWAKPHLRDVPRIKDGLVAIAMADTIRKQCPSINPRLVRAYQFLKSLEAYALRQGYSADEIDDFVNDKSEATRLLGLARASLISKGANYGSPDTFCAIGRKEIQNNSAVGNLLKEA